MPKLESLRLFAKNGQNKFDLAPGNIKNVPWNKKNLLKSHPDNFSCLSLILRAIKAVTKVWN